VTMFRSNQLNRHTQRDQTAGYPLAGLRRRLARTLSLAFDLPGSVSLVVVIILLFRLRRAVQQQAEGSRTLSVRGIQPEPLIKLASILAHLSETGVADLPT
jgi:hypothetical protein